MNQESLIFQPVSEKRFSPEEKVSLFIDDFLGENKSELTIKAKEKIILDTIQFQKTYEQKLAQPEGKKEVSCDLAREIYIVQGKKFSLGELVSSRHMGVDYFLPKDFSNPNAPELLRLLRAEIIKRTVEDYTKELVNKQISQVRAQQYNNRDLMKEKAYKAISERSGKSNEQTGILAEKMITGVLEKIEIDFPEFEIVFISTNAIQDVEQKMDFIIATKHKARGGEIDVSEDKFHEKSVGVQFTTNTSLSKSRLKGDQLEKARKKGLHVDDLVCVSLEKSILETAISEWKNDKSPVGGPWQKLSKEIRLQILTGLFDSVLPKELEQKLFEKALH